MDNFIQSIIKLTQNNKNLTIKKGKILVKEIDYKRKKYKIKPTSKELHFKMKNITNSIKNYISYYITEKPTDLSIPPGLCVYNRIYSEDILESIKNRLDFVYNKYSKEKEFAGIQMKDLFKKQEHGNRIFMFDNLDVYNFCRIAYQMDSILGKYLIKYVVDMLQMFKIPQNKIRELCENSKIVIARYESNTGLYVHIDLLRRGDGPVVTMSLGADYNIYDMIPLKDNIKSLRVYFPLGSIVVLNGEARYEWAHSLPYDLKYRENQVRYSIIFLMHNIGSVKKVWSDIYKTHYDFILHDCDYYTQKN